MHGIEEGRERPASHLTLRQRLTRGAAAQVFGHATRVVVQMGGVPLLIAAWGLHRYGDWLILYAVTQYVVWNDIGFVGAAMNEMIMAAGRGARQEALLVFQAVSAFVIASTVLVGIALIVIAPRVPVGSWLNLSTLGDQAAGWTIVMLGIDALLVVYGGLLYGGFASVGRYGEGAMWGYGVYLVEFGGLAAAVLVGGSPLVAAGAMLAVRTIGTTLNYLAMRRRVPWLRLGRPTQMRPVLRRLLNPALASGALPTAVMVNTQGLVLVLGLVAGSATVAVFSTLRTLSRGVNQLMASVFAIVTPEVSRAFAQQEHDLLRRIHRKACQATIWAALPIALGIAALGSPLMHVWTSGKVGTEGLLLYLFLVIAVVDSLWYTSLAMLYATNSHQRVALYYFVACLVNLPLGYLMYLAWGLDGVAVSILLVDGFMVIPVVRRGLAAASDNLRDWLGAIVRPPVSLAGLTALRASVLRW
jgi:O-antigen/teichoic acid export membrane protein